MGTFSVSTEAIRTAQENGRRDRITDRAALEEFSPAILGLGDITIKSAQIDGLCAVFDLEGFTNFCKQGGSVSSFAGIFEQVYEFYVR